MRRTCWRIGVFVSASLLSCTGDDGGSAGTGTDGGTEGGSEGGDGGAGGAMLGCPPGESCTLVLVSQTLDDRVEIFAAQGPTYRGAIDLDLKPNTCAGCEPGDNADGRLDEPFGLARAGGYLHVAVGHYPARDSGSLVSFPLAMFDDMPVGSTLAVADYFVGGSFTAPVLGVGLQEVEPIFVTPRGSRLLVGTFNNDLFASEDAWTMPGRLLVLDASDPTASPGVIDLGPAGCNGAGQVAILTDTTIGIACDGNEGVAILDVSDLETTALADVAGAVTTTLCDIPGDSDTRRVRYLGGDGSGGFLVAEGPTPQTLLSTAKLWHFDAACAMKGFIQLPAEGDWQLGEIEPYPSIDPANPAWLIASGSATMMTNRGVYVVQSNGGALEVCQAIPGFDPFWDTVDGPIEPYGLAVTADGSGVAVGAGPFQAAEAGPGYGRVLWGALAGTDDPCTMTATVTDLTDGTVAPAVNDADPSTFRRAPSVVEIVELAG